MKKDRTLIVVAGPTAVGKTAVAVRIALDLNTEIINADSRQVFREMHIGTAKPTLEEMAGIKHHFVGSLSLKDTFNAGIFEHEAMKICDSVFQKKSCVIVSGGSGLYINALCNGLDKFPKVDNYIRESLNLQYESSGMNDLLLELKQKDPAYYARVDLKNPQRIIRALEVIRGSRKPFSEFLNQEKTKRSFNILKIGLSRDRTDLYNRINIRIDNMVEAGLFEEAESLADFKDLGILQTVGYQEVFKYLDGDIMFNEAVDLIKRNTRRYSKRQLTWFGKDPDIKWLHPDRYTEIRKYIKTALNYD